jgi:hypothetical protein
MASPSAPWRPWPTCSGPVGLAETNSTIMCLAVGGLAAELARRGEHFAHHLLLGGRLQADVEEAGTGDVDRLHPLLEGGRGQQVFAQRSATWRGFFFSGLASCIAAVQARSPWAATLGDSNTALSPAPGDSFSSPAASAASRSCFGSRQGPGTCRGARRCRACSCCSRHRCGRTCGTRRRRDLRRQGCRQERQAPGRCRQDQLHQEVRKSSQVRRGTRLRSQGHRQERQAAGRRRQEQLHQEVRERRQGLIRPALR